MELRVPLDEFFKGIGILCSVFDVFVGSFLIEGKFLRNRIIVTENRDIAVLGCLGVFGQNNAVEWNVFASCAGKANLKHGMKEDMGPEPG